MFFIINKNQIPPKQDMFKLFPNHIATFGQDPYTFLQNIPKDKVLLEYQGKIEDIPPRLSTLFSKRTALTREQLDLELEKDEWNYEKREREQIKQLFKEVLPSKEFGRDTIEIEDLDENLIEQKLKERGLSDQEAARIKDDIAQEKQRRKPKGVIRRWLSKNG